MHVLSFNDIASVAQVIPCIVQAMKEVTADGFEEVQKAITTASGRVFILFTGSKVDGKSWCPDCVKGKVVLYCRSAYKAN